MPDIYPHRMKRARMKEAVELSVQGVEGFFEKTVTKFGTGAKIDCPKQYMGRSVYVIVRRKRARKEEPPPPHRS